MMKRDERLTGSLRGQSVSVLRPNASLDEESSEGGAWKHHARGKAHRYTMSGFDCAVPVGSPLAWMLRASGLRSRLSWCCGLGRELWAMLGRP